ncbi:hypothetical protein [Algibacter sp. L4_22]|uniref:hypothetical protein n=1 Tax=Algibacter sp. L4_22 TaxID=2942477 RepID=UPI00201B74E3|nr:hypothetical protein [Algibacter sp. L4_22]MCL5128461.1 hypothetical protein [Algibacter sp. L4_22]
MNNKIYLIALILLGNLMLSCESDDISHKNGFEVSHQVLEEFKISNNNSYKYIVTKSSWVGWYSETTITVSNGVIIKRHFEYFITDDLSEDITDEELEWTENEDEIGDHKYAGAEALTLDEVYDKAENEWLIDRDDSKVYFETENDGLISTCGYVHENCADDCFNGIYIKKIESI